MRLRRKVFAASPPGFLSGCRPPRFLSGYRPPQFLSAFRPPRFLSAFGLLFFYGRPSGNRGFSGSSRILLRAISVSPVPSVVEWPAAYVFAASPQGFCGFAALGFCRAFALRSFCRPSASAVFVGLRPFVFWSAFGQRGCWGLGPALLGRNGLACQTATTRSNSQKNSRGASLCAAEEFWVWRYQEGRRYAPPR